jgi:hypothetical protein
VAYGFETKFDSSDIDVVNRRLARCSKEAVSAVRKAMKQEAVPLAAKAARNAPRTSAKSAKREGPKHDTKRGALAKSIRARATGDSATIVGGGRARGPAPHFYAHEFGGGVLWSSPTTSKRHRIGVQKRSLSLKQAGLFNSAGNQRGATGWFFHPTLRAHEGEFVGAIVAAADEAVRETLKRG